MNSREHLSQDLDTLIKRTKQIGYVAWAVAILVMVFGTPIVFDFLTDHQIPGEVAWMLSLAADGALIVGLIATPVLAQLGVPAGWVGTLRYVTGFSTWALQTAGSWTAKDGPDGVGIAAHSFGPILLFFAVEAASSFQRKVGTALTDKARELEAAEQKDADRRAHLAELEANLRAARAEVSALTSERDGALQENERLTAELASVAHASTSETATLRTSMKALEEEKERLRDTYEVRLRAAANRAAEDLRKAEEARVEEVQRLKRDASEKLRQVRAEASVPHLSDRRRDKAGGVSGGGNLKPSNRARFNDEEAVQRLLETPSDPARNLPSGDVREWSQQAIVDTLGVGWTRAPRLLEAVTEEQARRRSEGAAGGKAVNE